MTTLDFQITDGRSLQFTPTRLLIAGFTGRDQAMVDAHLDELREMGVTCPEVTPTLIEVGTGLLSTTAEFTVAGEFTSGEVEAVLFSHDGELFVTVGSDHTDREMETISIPLSKEACPKLVGSTAAPLASIADWDAITAHSWLDDEQKPYQEGSLADLLTIAGVFELFEREGVQFGDGDAVFLGTFPVHGGLRPTPEFNAALRLPDGAGVLQLSYQVKVEK